MITGYKIHYVIMDDDQMLVQEVGSDQLNITLIYLRKTTTYVISVAALTIVGAGQVIQKQVTTGVPPG